jgi:hypothetical protein
MFQVKNGRREHKNIPEIPDGDRQPQDGQGWTGGWSTSEEDNFTSLFDRLYPQQLLLRSADPSGHKSEGVGESKMAGSYQRLAVLSYAQDWGLNPQCQELFSFFFQQSKWITWWGSAESDETKWQRTQNFSVTERRQVWKERGDRLGWKQLLDETWKNCYRSNWRK